MSKNFLNCNLYTVYQKLLLHNEMCYIVKPCVFYSKTILDLLKNIFMKLTIVVEHSLNII